MTRSELPVKIAVIGAGLIGKRHVRHVFNEPRCRLVGVIEPNLKARSLAESYGAAYYNDVAPFLKKGDAEAVIIATPNNTHASIGIQCARAGLHLLVEKPIEADLPAAADLVTAAQEAGVQLLVGHHRRFNPYVEATKKILDDGGLGRITAVNALWTTLKPRGYFDMPWRREAGGGPVMINLIHDIDNLRYLLGDIERIYAESSNAVRGYPVEDTTVISIRFQSGVLGTVVASDTVVSPYNFEAATGENPLVYAAGKDCYRIFGTEATLNFPEMTIWRYIGEGEHGWSEAIAQKHTTVDVTIPLERQLQHFCDVIRHGAVPRCPGQEGIKTLEATLAVREAAGRGEPVMLRGGNLEVTK